ncbi:MAG: PAS domain S-box protein, partial [Anaerolineales bacterium]
VRALETQETIVFEDYYKPFDRWFENRIHPSSDGLTIFFTDITERKKAEEALREQERFISAIADTSPAIVYIYDMGTQSNVYSNNGIMRMLGYSPRQLQAMGEDLFTHLIHPEDLPDVIAFQSKILAAADEGLLEIQYRMKHQDGGWRTFHSYERPFLRNKDGSLKQKIGIAIDITERKQAESLQDAIYQISEAANNSESLDELYQSVHSIISQVMPAHNFYIALYDEESDLISFPYYVDEADRFASASIAAARPGRGMTEYVIRTGKPLLSDIANFEELARRGEVELVGPPSPIWVGAPLIVEGRTIGAMAMQDYNDPNVYTERELRMLEYVSGQVAKAIERTRLESNIQRQNRILSALQEATLPLISQRELSEVLQAIAMQASQLLNTSHSYIDLVDRDEKMMHVVLGTGVFSRNIGLKLRRGEGLSGKIWQTAQQLNVQDYHTWAGRSAQFDDTELHAVVSVPLISGSRVIGVLGLAHLESERTFSQDDLDLLSRFAQLASIALTNARLHTQVRQELAERRMVQDALRKAEAKYRSLVERLPVVVYTSELGVSGLWHYVSPQIESLLGFTPEEWMADPNLWYQQMHPNDRAQQQALEEQAYASGEPFEGEYRMFTRNGREVWMRDSAQILPPLEGELPIVQGVLVDITGRKRAEESFHESEETTRLIIDTALDAVVTIDQDGQITRWNDQAEIIFGWRRAEAVGQHLSKLIIPPDLPARHERGLKHFLETGEGPLLGQRIEFTAQRRNGNIFPVELAMHALKASNRVSFAAFIRDITERKQTEENLLQPKPNIERWLNTFLRLRIPPFWMT